jgi:uncharacterized FAD-dependent dehydrogenase
VSDYQQEGRQLHQLQALCDYARFRRRGAFSDGKFNFTTQFGGWLNDYMKDSDVMDLIDYVDSVNLKFEQLTRFFQQQHREADTIRKKRSVMICI